MRKIDWEYAAWLVGAALVGILFGSCLLCMVGAVLLRAYVGW